MNKNVDYGKYKIAKGISCITGLKRRESVEILAEQIDCKRHFLYNGIETDLVDVDAAVRDELQKAFPV